MSCADSFDEEGQPGTGRGIPVFQPGTLANDMRYFRLTVIYGRILALWLISDSWLFCREVTTAVDEQTWDEQTCDEQMWDEPFTWHLTGFSSSPPRSDLHKRKCGPCVSNKADNQLKITLYTKSISSEKVFFGMYVLFMIFLFMCRYYYPLR